MLTNTLPSHGLPLSRFFPYYVSDTLTEVDDLLLKVSERLLSPVKSGAHDHTAEFGGGSPSSLRLLLFAKSDCFSKVLLNLIEFTQHSLAFLWCRRLLPRGNNYRASDHIFYFSQYILDVVVRFRSFIITCFN